jgi:gliding motility-associated lipoprotein GldB
MKKILGFLIAIIVISCNNNDKIEKEISQIHVEVAVDRFDQKFGKAGLDDLPKLKSEYPNLFPEQFHDSVWVARIKDTIQQELSFEVNKAFPNFNEQEEELHALFQHVKYYFPEFKSPKIITVTSDVDYKNRIIYADSLVLIGLDNYLGEEHHFYEGINKYLKKNFNKDQIVVNLTSEIAKRIIGHNRERTFLSHIIVYGKELYLKDKLIPFKTDPQKIGYTDQEYEWAVANESEVWRYFVEKDLLFSTDAKLLERFVLPSPFSKFYLELDNESPGRLGQYIGWQIVRAYMDNNNVSLQQMLKTPAEEIFKKSRFKPKK